MSFSLLYLLAAIGGGIVGAAVGGLPIFILCGAAAIIGAGIAAATGDATYSNLIAWGPIVGPQISFAAGAAAAAYAAKRGKLESGRDITSALLGLKSPDVLLVGGAFGALGYVLWWALANLPLIGDIGATNAIALSIVINAIVARLLFGKTGVFGKVRAGDNRWRASEVGVWLPWQTDPMELLVFGLGAAIVVSWSTVEFPALAGVWFGFATLGLIFLQFGVKVPVWHHVALASELAIAVGGGDIWWGVTFGLLGIFLGEFWAMLFTAHGDTHIDPPSASLATTFTIMALVRLAGGFNVTGVGSLAIALIVAFAGVAIWTGLKRRPNAGTPAVSAAD